MMKADLRMELIIRGKNPLPRIQVFINLESFIPCLFADTDEGIVHVLEFAPLSKGHDHRGFQRFHQTLADT